MLRLLSRNVVHWYATTASVDFSYGIVGKIRNSACAVGVCDPAPPDFGGGGSRDEG